MRAPTSLDAYPYSRPGDDAYLYLDPDQGRFHFLPHGLDEAFLPRDRPLTYVPGLLARRCLANAACRSDLAVHVDEVFTVLEPRWEEQVAEVSERIGSAVQDERSTVEPGVWDEASARYPAWLEERRLQLEQELAEL